MGRGSVAITGRWIERKEKSSPHAAVLFPRPAYFFPLFFPFHQNSARRPYQRGALWTKHTSKIPFVRFRHWQSDSSLRHIAVGQTRQRQNSTRTSWSTRTSSRRSTCLLHCACTIGGRQQGKALFSTDETDGNEKGVSRRSTATLLFREKKKKRLKWAQSFSTAFLVSFDGAPFSVNVIFFFCVTPADAHETKKKKGRTASL